VGKKRTPQKETAVPTSARDKMLAVQVEDYNVSSTVMCTSVQSAVLSCMHETRSL